MVELSPAITKSPLEKMLVAVEFFISMVKVHEPVLLFQPSTMFECADNSKFSLSAKVIQFNGSMQSSLNFFKIVMFSTSILKMFPLAVPTKAYLLFFFSEISTTPFL